MLFWGVCAFVAACVEAANVRCSNDEDCSLNGVCVNNSCLCDPGWTTLPFGPNNTLSPGCGYLDFLPSPISACGNACAFHGGDGGVDRKTTSWGGSVLFEDGRYWMFAAEMANHCGLGQWTTNSRVQNGIPVLFYLIYFVLQYCCCIYNNSRLLFLMLPFFFSNLRR